MERPEQRMPRTELIQPDPQLQLSSGRASGLQITLVALACALILGVMIYGLSRPMSEDQITAVAPPAQETTGAAPPVPQSGGNVAGGENAAPKPEATPPSEPAQQPVPQMTKPGVTEDDSKR